MIDPAIGEMHGFWGLCRKFGKIYCKNTGS